MLPDKGFVVNPTEPEMQQSSLDMMLAGTADALLMIEGYCDFLTDEQMTEVPHTPQSLLTGNVHSKSLGGLQPGGHTKGLY